MFNEFFPFRILDNDHPYFHWTINTIQEKIVDHLENVVKNVIYTIREEELVEKMKRKEICNRKELKECLALYLKFNYLLLNKNSHDWDFIIRIDGNNLKEVSDPEFKCYTKLITHINSQIPQIINEIKKEDILIFKGYRRNKNFHISEFKKEDEKPPQKLNFSNSCWNTQANSIYAQLSNPEILYKFIVSTLHHRKYQEQNFVTNLIAKQCLELPRRNIKLRMENVCHLFGNRFNRFNQQRLFRQYPTTVHISKLTSQLSISYESPMNVLISPAILKVVMECVAVILSLLVLLYCNTKVFGFTYFFNSISVLEERIGFSLTGFFKFFPFVAYYLIVAYVMYLPIGIVMIVLGDVELLLYALYFLLNVLLYLKNYTLNVDIERKYYLAPIELTQMFCLLHALGKFQILGMNFTFIKDWSIQLFRKAKKALLNYFSK
ncbi:predicted protein [Naegleria gruberi]|uniref:Predicted protein n=1 Tax=Naegleria gruberi TaxID=5762 RepID=D2V2A1_NAEGR|nr:uncharacterized protein NAEGRDRAFT_62930 [Naegleria gruberi]EFC49020.1 predicted protein [Naegleria gruberi]|eukprot:XP_002681764.1 predicted protein [Naegleria gruberi strain NEG-M]